jgi:glycine/D-amino acid oxidase-like deaminating enzyme/nitrite reductase/ring-hydroxylating ferredoxin subunit
MANPPEHGISIWQATAEAGAANPLRENLTTDVCIVGAGIAGLSIARTLVREGKSVVVLDALPLGSGMTGRTTAHLVNALDDRYIDLEKYHGEEGARIAAESHTAAIDSIERIVREEGIECDFERLDGYLFLPPGASAKIIEDELAATHRAGISTEKIMRLPIEGFETGPALRFPRQAQFHPLRYLAGLVRVIEGAGGRVFTGTRVVEAVGGKDAHVQTTDGFTVRASAIVMATNTPVNDRYAIHTKQAPYTTYVIGLRVPAGSVPHALFWDTAQEAEMQEQSGPIPYHYVRLQRTGTDEVLIVGGEDHKTGQAGDMAERFARLESWTRERFPRCGEVEFTWSGQVMEPVDGVAFIGRNPFDEENVFIVTGDSGNGMTHGALAGILIPDLILGRANRWADLYDPSRIRVRAAGEFVRENLNVAKQFTDYLTGGDVALAGQIANGEGALLRHGLSKIAAYRDEHGALHEFSAVCPHLKCIVHWNNAEKTWDCPCHGSRFDCHGHVITGPAISDLTPVEETATRSS